MVMLSRNSAFLAIATVIGVAVACGDSSTPDVPGTTVKTTISSARQADLAALQPQLDAVASLDAPGFAAKYALPFVTDLGYDATKAVGLDMINKSALSLSANELAALGARGFVISDRQKYPNFIYGYQSIYQADLPVYVSADSILFAIHKSFDSILELIEEQQLVPTLARLLTAMRSQLAAGSDARLYVDVALGLLQNTAPAGESAASLYAAAVAASGPRDVQLFGTTRTIDFSLFTPRGHYTDTATLSQYFRASTWLGTVDLRILETQPDGSQIFRRAQLEGAYALRAAMNAQSLADWTTLDETIGGFVGEHDNMVVPQLDSLLADLELTSADGLKTLDDATIAQAIVNGNYGAQRISSAIMENGLGTGTLPLSSSFLLLGQRYVVDSHVFSNLVYDRVGKGSIQRMMPSPLDVGFAAIGNNEAGLLLKDELAKYPYAPDLASMRVLVDAHPAEFWDENLYNEWLGMVRALSPVASEVGNPAAAGLPRVMGTEPWSKRIVSSQLGSWAELRHDTILYAKQSVSGYPSCEYPSAYIEPYPEFYARLGAFAAKGTALLAAMPSVAPYPGAPNTAQQYFANLSTVAAQFEGMAKAERAGADFTADQLAFINQLVFHEGCGTPSFDGWYAKLFFDQEDAVQYRPPVADVHTDPSSGNILEVATGKARLMVVTVESCSGPHAYVGLASSYYDFTSPNFTRLTDDEWGTQLLDAPPADPIWLNGLIEH